MVWSGVVFLLIQHVIVSIGRPNISATAVCGSDGISYKDEEDLKLAQSEKADLQLLHLGPCLKPVQESLLQNSKPTYRGDGHINEYHLKVNLPGINMEYVGSRPGILEKLMPDYKDFARIGKLRGGYGGIWVYDPTLHLSSRPYHVLIYQPSYPPLFRPHDKLFHQPFIRPPYLPSYQPSPNQLFYQPFHQPSYPGSYHIYNVPSYELPYQPRYSPNSELNYPLDSQLYYPSESQLKNPNHSYLLNNGQNIKFKYNWKDERNSWKDHKNQLPDYIYTGDQSVNNKNIGKESFYTTPSIDFKENMLENLDNSQKSHLGPSHPGLDSNLNFDSKSNLSAESTPTILDYDSSLETKDNSLHESFPSQPSELEEIFTPESIHKSLDDDNKESSTEYSLIYSTEDIDHLEDNKNSSDISINTEKISDLNYGTGFNTDIPLDPPTGDVYIGLQQDTGSTTDPSHNLHVGDALHTLPDNTIGSYDHHLNPFKEYEQPLEERTERSTESYLNPNANDSHSNFNDSTRGIDSDINRQPDENLPGLEDNMEANDNDFLNSAPEEMQTLDENTEGSPSSDVNSQENVQNSEDSARGNTDIYLNSSKEIVADRLEERTGDSIDSSLNSPPEDVQISEENLGDNSGSDLNLPENKQQINTGDSIDSSLNPLSDEGPTWIGDADGSRGPDVNPSENIQLWKEIIGSGTDSSLNPPPADAKTSEENTESNNNIPIYRPPENLDFDSQRDPSQIFSSEDVSSGLENDETFVDPHYTPSINDSPESMYSDDTAGHVDPTLHTPPEYTPSGFEDYPVDGRGEDLEPPTDFVGKKIPHEYSNDYPDYYFIEFHPNVNGNDLESSLTDLGVEDTEKDVVGNSVWRGTKDSATNSVGGDHAENNSGNKVINGVNAERNLFPESVIANESYEIIDDGGSYEHTKDFIKNNNEFGKYIQVPTVYIPQDTGSDESDSLEDDLPSHSYRPEHNILYDEPCDIQNWFTK